MALGSGSSSDDPRPRWRAKRGANRRDPENPPRHAHDVRGTTRRKRRAKGVAVQTQTPMRSRATALQPFVGEPAHTHSVLHLPQIRSSPRRIHWRSRTSGALFLFLLSFAIFFILLGVGAYFYAQATAGV